MHRLLDEGVHQSQGNAWLEPMAGDGAIVRAVEDYSAGTCNWTAVEIQRKFAEPLRKAVNDCHIRNFFDWVIEQEDHKYDLTITNPPFKLAFESLKQLRRISKEVILLLRIGFLEGGASPATKERRSFLDADTPDVYLLPNRPTFVRNAKGHWGTDGATYAWMHWGSVKKTEGKFKVLGLTDREQIKASRM